MIEQPGARMAPPVPSPDDETDWDDCEPGMKEAAHEVQRVLRRAAARPLFTLVGAAIITLLLLGMVVRKVPLHRARVILRVQENVFAGDLALAYKGDLKNHIFQVILSRDRVLGVIDRHHLYPSARQRGDDEAVAEFRDALDVREFRNYFLIGHGEENQRASVRIAISFTDPDHRVATAVIEDLAQLVIQSENERRKAVADAAVSVADEAVLLATAELEERQSELASKRYLMTESTGADRAALRVAVLNLERSLRAYHAILDEARAHREAVALAVGAEAHQLGVSIEVAQYILPPPPPKSRTPLLVVVGTLGFLFALPLFAIAVGAFDSRVYDLEDVERIGMAGIGHVPRFAGESDGSLDQRVGRRSFWQRLRRRR